MAIPSFQDFMLPMLELMRDGEPHKMLDIKEKLAEYFNLSEEEKKMRLPSGKQVVYKFRIGWARTYLYYAGLIERVDKGVYKITERGLEVLREKPSKINVNYLMRFPEFREFLNKGKEKTTEDDKSTQGISETETPIETIDRAYQFIKGQLAKEILERIMQKPPEFFEKLIIDLLQAMGYGGSLEDAGNVTKRTSDEGIDGIIKEDKLGLDVIYIQAKRWSPDRLVGRPEIQKFVESIGRSRCEEGDICNHLRFHKRSKGV